MVKHPNIVECYGACTKGEKPFILMEYFQRGSLRKVMEGIQQTPDLTTKPPPKPISFSQANLLAPKNPLPSRIYKIPSTTVLTKRGLDISLAIK